MTAPAQILFELLTAWPGGSRVMRGLATGHRTGLLLWAPAVGRPWLRGCWHWGAGAALPTVTIGGISATGIAIAPETTDALIATVVDAPAGKTPLTGTKDVVVTPPLASPISAPDVITIVPDKPEIAAVSRQPIKAGDPITATGNLLLAPGTTPGNASPGTSSAGGVTPSLTTAAGQDWPITVEGPYKRDEVTLRVGAQPGGLGAAGATGDATLKLTRGTQEASNPVKYQVT